MRKTFRLLCIALTLCTAPLLPQSSLAQGAPGSAIPADAREGTLEAANGQMALDDVRYPVTAALQVRGADNQLISIHALRGSFRVRYRFDAAGTLHRIWILERL